MAAGETGLPGVDSAGFTIAQDVYDLLRRVVLHHESAEQLATVRIAGHGISSDNQAGDRHVANTGHRHFRGVNGAFILRNWCRAVRLHAACAFGFRRARSKTRSGQSPHFQEGAATRPVAVFVRVLRAFRSVVRFFAGFTHRLFLFSFLTNHFDRFSKALR